MVLREQEITERNLGRKKMNQQDLIQMRRRILNMFQGKEKDIRPTYWSNIDQQERYPGDAGFQFAAKHNSPLHRHVVTQAWLTGMGRNDVPIPLSVELKNVLYWIRSAIHPEYIWTTNTKRFQKIKAFIQKVIDFFAISNM